MDRDRDLVEAAQRGDQAAFVDLVRSTGDRLFALGYRILRDVDRTEDALQDALVIAWRDLRGLRDPDRFDAWINRVVTNVCIAHATRERRRTVNLRVLPLDGPAAPDDLLGVGDRDQLERGFRRLTPDERAILVLHHYAGYSLAEIADTIGYNLLAGTSTGVGGPAATSSPSPTTSPTAAPSLRSISSTAFRPATQAAVPPGWVIADDQDRAFLLQAPAGSSGTPSGGIEIRRGPAVGSNDQDCTGLPAAGIGHSATAIVAGLTADPRFTTTLGGDVNVGGLPGQALDVEVAPTWTGTCSWSGGKPAAVLLTVTDPPGPWLGIAGTERVRLILVDLGYGLGQPSGTVGSITIDAADRASFDAVLAEIMPTVQSIQFKP